MTAAVGIVPLRQEQLDEVGDVLTRAFADDPFVLWMFPKEQSRPRVLRAFMLAGANYCHRYGETYTTSGRPEGAALWLTPGNTHMTVPRMARSGMLLLPFRLGAGNFVRFNSAVSHMERSHNRIMAGPHWYLLGLGVDPPRQGQGLGSALIAAGLEKADASGLPCYLETAKERNLPFYERHGFTTVEETRIDNGKAGPRVWMMRREPGAGNT
jgi:ribosomal protein S18 acetylase RimI-like enzyme